MERHGFRWPIAVPIALLLVASCSSALTNPDDKVVNDLYFQFRDASRNNDIATVRSYWCPEMRSHPRTDSIFDAADEWGPIKSIEKVAPPINADTVAPRATEWRRWHFYYPGPYVKDNDGQINVAKIEGHWYVCD